jgi:Sperm tail
MFEDANDNTSIDSNLTNATNKSVLIDETALMDKKELKKHLKAQKKLEKSQQQFRDYLTRENNFNKTSIDRGWDDWEKWWREVNVDGLKEDLRAAAQSLNRLMDKSDHVVETIKIHREHADEQYFRNFAKNCEMIDYVFGEKFCWL